MRLPWVAYSSNLNDNLAKMSSRESAREKEKVSTCLTISPRLWIDEQILQSILCLVEREDAVDDRVNLMIGVEFAHLFESCLGSVHCEKWD